LPEEFARYFFQQFISGVAYLHSHHIAHRDLKLANTLVDDSVPPRIKICDVSREGYSTWGAEESQSEGKVEGRAPPPSLFPHSPPFLPSHLYLIRFPNFLFLPLNSSACPACGARTRR
jgi:serine/threonine protein kinase